MHSLQVNNLPYAPNSQFNKNGIASPSHDCLFIFSRTCLKRLMSQYRDRLAPFVRTHGNWAPSQHPIDIHPNTPLSHSEPILPYEKKDNGDEYRPRRYRCQGEAKVCRRRRCMASCSPAHPSCTNPVTQPTVHSEDVDLNCHVEKKRGLIKLRGFGSPRRWRIHPVEM